MKESLIPPLATIVRALRRRRAATEALATALATTIVLLGSVKNAESAQDAAAVPLSDASRQMLDSSTSNVSRSLSIGSSADSGAVRAESVGVIDRPFRDLTQALGNAGQWCAVMLLHINNQQCRTTSGQGAPHLILRVARKYDQSAEQGFDIDFTYRVIESGPALLSVRLEAPDGPLGTSNYVMRLDAVALDERRTTLRLSYAFHRGLVSSVAMDVYLATIGHGKVGFTVTGRTAGGESEYIGGLRGMVERNLILYFFAVEAAANEPDGVQENAWARRLRRWFQSTEEYPRQLHEIDQATYLNLKRLLKPIIGGA